MTNQFRSCVLTTCLAIAGGSIVGCASHTESEKTQMKADQLDHAASMQREGEAKVESGKAMVARGQAMKDAGDTMKGDSTMAEGEAMKKSGEAEMEEGMKLKNK